VPAQARPKAAKNALPDPTKTVIHLVKLAIGATTPEVIHRNTLDPSGMPEGLCRAYRGARPERASRQVPACQATRTRP